MTGRTSKTVWMTKTPKPSGPRDSTPMTLRSWPKLVASVVIKMTLPLNGTCFYHSGGASGLIRSRELRTSLSAIFR